MTLAAANPPLLQGEGRGEGPAAGTTLSANLVHFAALLRRAGLRTGPDATVAAAQALTLVGLDSRARVQAALRATLAQRHEDQPIFDAAFDLFWRDPTAEAHAAALGMLENRRPPEPPKPSPGARRIADAIQAPRETRPAEDRPEIDMTMTVSDREQLQSMDFEQMSAAQLASRPRRDRPPRPAARPPPHAPLPPGPHRPPYRPGRHPPREPPCRRRPRRPRAPPPHRPTPAAGRALRHLRIHGPLRPGAPPLPPRRRQRPAPRPRLPVRHPPQQHHPPAPPSGRGSRLPDGERLRARLVRRHPHRREHFPVQPRLVPPRPGTGRRRAAHDGWFGPGRGRRAGRGDGAPAPLQPPPRLAQPPVALGRVQAQVTRHPRDAAARRRVPHHPQPRQPSRPGHDPIAPAPRTRHHGGPA